jgi:ADP-heptose:LPS heptosyltransferase
LELFQTDEGRTEALARLSDAKVGSAPLIVLHPGCGADGLPREWPVGEYAVLGHWLMKNAPQAKLVLTGGPEERKKTGDLNRLLKGRGIDLGGKLSWAGLISLVSKAALVVSGNTGIMHVAAALGRPQVALHGPTNPRLWGPINDRAVIVSTTCPQCPCLKLGFEYHQTGSSCMARIQVDDVRNAVARVFDIKQQI